MLQVQNFSIGDPDKLNAFIKEHVPLKNGIFCYESSVTVLYDDGQPFNKTQRRNMIVLQMGSIEEQLLEAEVNVRLTKLAGEDSKGKSAEQIKEIMAARNQAVASQKEKKQILSVLSDMLNSNGDNSTEESG